MTSLSNFRNIFLMVLSSDGGIQFYYLKLSPRSTPPTHMYTFLQTYQKNPPTLKTFHCSYLCWPKAKLGSNSNQSDALENLGIFSKRSHVTLTSLYNPQAQRLKRLPGMWETRVRSLSQEDSLEKEMAPHSSTLAWRIPWREEPGRLQSMGSQRVRHD